MLRLISQDELTDVPYDHVVVRVVGEKVFAINPGTDGSTGVWELAAYTTPEKVHLAINRMKQRAQKVIMQKELGGNYRYYDMPKAYRFPRDEELEG